MCLLHVADLSMFLAVTSHVDKFSFGISPESLSVFKVEKLLAVGIFLKGSFVRLL